MKVAIAGYGIEGKASLKYWLGLGNEITVVDELATELELPEGVKSMTGEGVLSRLQDFDLVIRTASLNPDKITTNAKIWSATNEFFAKCPAPIIGVTGTKGKGTTSSLIASILREAGYTVHLVGNIGVAGLDELPKIRSEDIVVYELSSFQLWDLERSPHVAVVLPIEADHLDIHRDFEDYVGAKANIARYQLPDDKIVYFEANPESKKIADMSGATQRVPYPFATDLTDALVIPGQHNKDNACAAIAAVSEYCDDDAIIRRGLASFTGLPHRLKLVRELDGVSYYDDSISTTPGSATAAVRSFPDRHKILILGGSDKGGDYKALVDSLIGQDVYVLAIGQTGEKIGELCESAGISWGREVGMMPDVVASARSKAKSGDVVLLSPASASFDQYANYAARGEAFIEAVQSL